MHHRQQTQADGEKEKRVQPVHVHLRSEAQAQSWVLFLNPAYALEKKPSELNNILIFKTK